jgi:hypothetical protein
VAECRHCPSGDGRVASDLECVVCQYNLKTLSTAGLCPECGTRVARSVQETSVYGKGGRRRLFWRFLLANTIALYLPGAIFFLFLPSDFPANLLLATVSPLVLPTLLLDQHSSELPVAMLTGGIVLSGTLPYLLARFAVWLTSHTRFSWIVPVSLFGVVLLEVLSSLVMIFSAL